MAAPLFHAHVSASSTPDPLMATNCVPAGDEVWLHVPATAGDIVHGVSSGGGVGAGPCSVRLGLCLDVLPPMTYLGNVVAGLVLGADGNDYGSVPFAIDASAEAGSRTWLQGVVEDGSDSEISFAIEVEVCSDSWPGGSGDPGGSS